MAEVKPEKNISSMNFNRLVIEFGRERRILAKQVHGKVLRVAINNAPFTLHHKDRFYAIAKRRMLKQFHNHAAH